MLKALNNLGVDYLVHVKQNATFTSRRGHPCLLQALIKPGEQITVRGTLFRGHKQVRGIIHLTWEAGQHQPGCLITNDRSIRGSLYARRVWQEQSFRDLKSGGWHWGDSRLRHPDHVARLLVLLAIAYTWIVALGSQAVAAGRGRPLVQRANNACPRLWSLFKEGLNYFVEFVQRHTVCLGLVFISDRRST